MAFQFEKPEGFTFTAGQSFDMTLRNPPETDREGNGRTFPSRMTDMGRSRRPWQERRESSIMRGVPSM